MHFRCSFAFLLPLCTTWGTAGFPALRTANPAILPGRFFATLSLQEFLSSIFIEADQDNSGTLSYKEFKEVRATPPTTPIPSTTLGVGAWAWGDKLFWGYDDNQETQACEAFNTAVDLGVTLFDTAEVYKTLSIQKARELPTQHLRWRCIHCALL